MLRRDPTPTRRTRRDTRRPPPRRRRDRDRQDEPARARRGRDQPRVGLRTHPEPVGSDQDQRRLQRGLGGRGRDRHRADQPGLGHGRFGKDPGCVLRDLGPETNTRAALDPGHDAARPRDGLPGSARRLAEGPTSGLGGGRGSTRRRRGRGRRRSAPRRAVGTMRARDPSCHPARGRTLPRRRHRGARRRRVVGRRHPSCVEPARVAGVRRALRWTAPPPVARRRYRIADPVG